MNTPNRVVIARNPNLNEIAVLLNISKTVDFVSSVKEQ